MRSTIFASVVREHRRAEAAPEAVDRGWERRDQRGDFEGAAIAAFRGRPFVSLKIGNACAIAGLHFPQPPK
jgi:hypothetical protein